MRSPAIIGGNRLSIPISNQHPGKILLDPFSQPGMRMVKHITDKVDPSVSNREDLIIILYREL